MWVRKGDIAMSCLPKNGSTSMRNVGLEFCEHKDVLDCSVRVGWIREPMERWQSAYSFFYWLTQEGVHTDIDAKEVRSYEAFVDYALGEDNKHWSPQVDQLTYNGEFLPTVCHKFTDIMELWGTYIPGLLPWQNACTQMPINNYRDKEIREYLAKDFELWHSL